MRQGSRSGSARVGEDSKREGRHRLTQRQRGVSAHSSASEKFRGVFSREWRRQLCRRVFPLLADRRKPDTRRKSRHQNRNPFPLMLAREGHTAIGKLAAHRERQIAPAFKQLRVLTPKSQEPLRE